MAVFQRLHRYLKHLVRFLLMGGIFLTYSSTAEAPLDVRVALVIGNAAYMHIPALGNSTNDARSMAGNVIKRVSNKVVNIENGFVYIENDFGQEIRTLDGGVVKTNVTDNKFSYDPPRIDMPGDELIVGKKWSIAYSQTDSAGRGTLRQDAKIVALEKVTTPAGTFLAYKIEVDGYIGMARTKQIYWCEPDWGERIKWIRTVFRPRGTLRETYELESRVRGSGGKG